MQFIIQKNKDFDIETEILRNEIKGQKYLHEYFDEDMSFFDNENYYSKIRNIEKTIPVGSIEFVTNCLKHIHNIDFMAPIEIPKVLRKPEYLMRDYKIITADKIPTNGVWFIKDVSRLKQFSYCGEMSLFMYDGIFDKPKKHDTSLHLNDTHKFALSEPVPILSEYRVFVSRDNIKAIQYYDGDPTIMPSPTEINKIKQMVTNYMLDNTRPSAYAMDIAIIRTKTGSRDLAIIELCPFACVGTYGFCGSELPYMYTEGFRWYLDHNKEIEE